MPDIVALGDVNVDIIGHFSDYPVRGSDAFARSHAFRCGGSAANTAMALARMGCGVSLIARLGSDPLALTARASLAEAGVGCSLLQWDPNVGTGLMYVVVTPDGERTILGYRGANALTDPDQIDETALAGARHFHLSGYALLADPQRSAALRCHALARQHGLTISLDPGTTASEAVLSQVTALLPEVDILLPTLEEARKITGLDSASDCARSLQSLGSSVVALKLGQAGCLVAGDGQVLRIPGLDVQVQDSTGAGDSFAAGMIIGHLAGLSPGSTAVLANAMGAVAAARVGGGPPAAMQQEVLALLRDPRHHQILNGFVDDIARALAYVETLTNESALEGST